MKCKLSWCVEWKKVALFWRGGWCVVKSISDLRIRWGLTRYNMQYGILTHPSMHLSGMAWQTVLVRGLLENAWRSAQCLPDHASSRCALLEIASAAMMTAKTGLPVQSWGSICGGSREAMGEDGSTLFQPWLGKPPRPSPENSTNIVPQVRLILPVLGDRNCNVFGYLSSCHAIHIGKESQLRDASRVKRLLVLYHLNEKNPRKQQKSAPWVKGAYSVTDRSSNHKPWHTTKCVSNV